MEISSLLTEGFDWNGWASDFEAKSNDLKTMAEIGLYACQTRNSDHAPSDCEFCQDMRDIIIQLAQFPQGRP